MFLISAGADGTARTKYHPHHAPCVVMQPRVLGTGPSGELQIATTVTTSYPEKYGSAEAVAAQRRDKASRNRMYVERLARRALQTYTEAVAASLAEAGAKASLGADGVSIEDADQVEIRNELPAPNCGRSLPLSDQSSGPGHSTVDPSTSTLTSVAQLQPPRAIGQTFAMDWDFLQAILDGAAWHTCKHTAGLCPLDEESQQAARCLMLARGDVEIRSSVFDDTRSNISFTDAAISAWNQVLYPVIEQESSWGPVDLSAPFPRHVSTMRRDDTRGNLALAPSTAITACVHFQRPHPEFSDDDLTAKVEVDLQHGFVIGDQEGHQQAMARASAGETTVPVEYTDPDTSQPVYVFPYRLILPRLTDGTA